MKRSVKHVFQNSVLLAVVWFYKKLDVRASHVECHKFNAGNFQLNKHMRRAEEIKSFLQVMIRKCDVCFTCGDEHSDLHKLVFTTYFFFENTTAPPIDIN